MWRTSPNRLPCVSEGSGEDARRAEDSQMDGDQTEVAEGHLLEGGAAGPVATALPVVDQAAKWARR